ATAAPDDHGSVRPVPELASAPAPSLSLALAPRVVVITRAANHHGDDEDDQDEQNDDDDSRDYPGRVIRSFLCLVLPARGFHESVDGARDALEKAALAEIRDHDVAHDASGYRVGHVRFGA